MGSFPPITGSRRIDWTRLPADVATAVEQLLGGPIVAAVSQPGGFSEGLAARVRLADGRRAFVKAASVRTAPAAASFHRREAAITRRLPAGAPVPRLLGSFHTGDWVALAFEEIDGCLPTLPWRPDDLDRVLAAATEVAELMTPSPVDAGLLAPPRLGGWEAIAADATASSRLAALAPWAARHLDRLVRLDQNAASALAGQSLLHGDLYPFNILLAGQRVVFVDWPHAWIGNAGCDVLTVLSSASIGGVDPGPLARRHPLTRDLQAEQVDAFLAAHAGFLLRLATSAGRGGDPRLLETATALGLASLRWLKQRYG
jgi:aminoglycoside phosphotransferase (APT) family kinase protein